MPKMLATDYSSYIITLSQDTLALTLLEQFIPKLQVDDTQTSDTYGRKRNIHMVISSAVSKPIRKYHKKYEIRTQ